MTDQQWRRFEVERWRSALRDRRIELRSLDPDVRRDVFAAICVDLGFTPVPPARPAPRPGAGLKIAGIAGVLAVMLLTVLGGGRGEQVLAHGKPALTQLERLSGCESLYLDPGSADGLVRGNGKARMGTLTC